MREITLNEFLKQCEGYTGSFGERPLHSLGYQSDRQFTLNLDHDIKITIPMYTELEGNKKRYIATVEEDYARDTQIYIGKSPEGSFDSDEWVDVKHPSLYLGVVIAPNEATARKELAAQVGCDPEIITLQEINLNIERKKDAGV